VDLQVDALPAGRTAQLVVTSEQVLLMWTDQRACASTLTGMTCTLAGGSTTRTRVNVVALAGASITATLVFTEPDPDPSNNTWRAVLD
jgi:hypothetical protein